jgi:hypothetical protein
MPQLKFADLESFYDELATAIDVVGLENEGVFLAKLVLSIAQEFGQPERLSALLADCLKAPETSLATGTRVV